MGNDKFMSLNLSEKQDNSQNTYADYAKVNRAQLRTTAYQTNCCTRSIGKDLQLRSQSICNQNRAMPLNAHMDL